MRREKALTAHTKTVSMPNEGKVAARQTWPGFGPAQCLFRLADHNEACVRLRRENPVNP